MSVFNMPFSFDRFRLNPGILLVGIIAFIGLIASGDASAADTLNRGAEFQEVYELVHDWATGYLGKTISVCFLIIGLCLGISRGSILAAASCICAAVALLLAPTIVDTLFAAHA